MENKIKKIHTNAEKIEFLSLCLPISCNIMRNVQSQGRLFFVYFCIAQKDRERERVVQCKHILYALRLFCLSFWREKGPIVAYILRLSSFCTFYFANSWFWLIKKKNG